MADGKKSFILYCDQKGTWDKLSNEQAGVLIKHVIAYVNDENPIAPDFITELAFEPIKATLKRDLIKWERQQVINIENGKKGGRPSKANETEQNQNNPVGFLETQSNPKKGVSVSASASGTVNGTAIKKERSVPPPPPTIDEVIAYFKENKYTEQSAIKAFGYYQASVTETKKHWSDGKGNPIKNWKMKMQSVWFKDENKEVVTPVKEDRNNYNGNIRFASPIL